MLKRIIDSPETEPSAAEEGWLDLAQVAQAEMTSEDADHPIESALLPGSGSGWRAAAPGKQTIRIRFTQPQRIRRIRLRFVEPDIERTQELVLRWSADEGRTFREIVRQQWTFSPHGSSSEIEDYRMELDGVSLIDLTIIPDIGGSEARASLAELRLA